MIKYHPKPSSKTWRIGNDHTVKSKGNKSFIRETLWGPEYPSDRSCSLLTDPTTSIVMRSRFLT